MFRPRIVPVLLIDHRGHAVKTVRFKNPLDLGDPVNTVSLFNSFEVDELVVVDIAATRLGRSFQDELLTDIVSEAKMPLSIGGGVSTCEHIYRLLHAGAEKVILRSAALGRPEFVRDAVRAFASSSISVSIDAKRDWRGRHRVLTAQGSLAMSPAEAARLMEDMGAGEIIAQSVDQDGRMNGYDKHLIASVADAVGVPVIALGGAGCFAHFAEANEHTNASAFASGSAFCFQDARRGVLISYPSTRNLATLARDL